MTEATLLDFLLADAPDGATFLRAQPHPQITDSWWCYQPFKPLADGLPTVHTTLQDVPTSGHIYLMGSRQKEENRALLAAAAAALTPMGKLTALLPNDLGAKSLEKDIKALFGNAVSTSKHHARRITATKQTLDEALLTAWQALATPNHNGAEGYKTAPGMFSWRKVDVGSALLAKVLNPKLAGHVADLGAGWGYLSAETLNISPNITAIDLFEAEHLALDCAKLNLAGASIPVTYNWADVATMPTKRMYDTIITNPPVHDLHDTDIALGQRFIEQALNMANPGARIYVVANRRLPYEALLTKTCKRVEVLTEGSGYKVLEARR